MVAKIILWILNIANSVSFDAGTHKRLLGNCNALVAYASMVAFVCWSFVFVSEWTSSNYSLR